MNNKYVHPAEIKYYCTAVPSSCCHECLYINTIRIVLEKIKTYLKLYIIINVSNTVRNTDYLSLRQKQ